MTTAPRSGGDDPAFAIRQNCPAPAKCWWWGPFFVCPSLTLSPMTFQPGRPLPNDSTATQERSLYHAPRASGQLATMTREGGTWQWRQLHGQADDDYGTGTWSEMQRWLGR